MNNYSITNLLLSIYYLDKDLSFYIQTIYLQSFTNAYKIYTCLEKRNIIPYFERKWLFLVPKKAQCSLKSVANACISALKYYVVGIMKKNK